MESAKVEVKTSVICHTTVSAGRFDPELGWHFTLEGFPIRFWLSQSPDLRPGDRVKITITKEPEDAKGS